MRLRSTGLGKTELEGKIVGVKKVEDLVIFCIDVTKPVKWKARMAFQERDLRALIKAILKPKNLCFVLRALFSKEAKVPRTETF